MQAYAGSVLSCETAQTLEARSRIIEVLQLNRELKQAVRERISYDARNAAHTVHRACQQVAAKRLAQNLRREGYYQATVYLETPEHEEQPQPNWRVEVFGEFTLPPWSERIRCRYDPKLQCFKADITIKEGQQFKFVVDEGRKYLVSARYTIHADHQGNENNEYRPKQLRWNRREKKSRSPLQPSRSPNAVGRRQTAATRAQAQRRLTPAADPSADAKDALSTQAPERP